MGHPGRTGSMTKDYGDMFKLEFGSTGSEGCGLGEGGDGSLGVLIGCGAVVGIFGVVFVGGGDGDGEEGGCSEEQCRGRKSHFW